MVFVIGLLTALLVLDCLFLVLLVLMQLPKKEAGAGLAFGGAATDALFGAGSGNFLTKATKYAAIAFFLLVIILAVLQNKFANREGSEFRRLLEQQAGQAPAATTQPAPPAGSAPAVAPATNIMILPTPSAQTNGGETPANPPAEE